MTAPEALNLVPSLETLPFEGESLATRLVRELVHDFKVARAEQRARHERARRRTTNYR